MTGRDAVAVVLRMASILVLKYVAMSSAVNGVAVCLDGCSRMLRIKWTDKIYNEEVLQRVDSSRELITTIIPVSWDEVVINRQKIVVRCRPTNLSVGFVSTRSLYYSL